MIISGLTITTDDNAPTPPTPAANGEKRSRDELFVTYDKTGYCYCCSDVEEVAAGSYS